MTDYAEHKAQDARLVILRQLHEEPDGALNETLLRRILDDFGHRMSREWVRTQLLKLKELGAIRLREAGSITVAEITAAGVDHVERRSRIDGIAVPSRGE